MTYTLPQCWKHSKQCFPPLHNQMQLYHWQVWCSYADIGRISCQLSEDQEFRSSQPQSNPIWKARQCLQMHQIIYPFAKYIDGMPFFPQVKSSLQSGNVKTYMNFLSGSHIPLSEPHNFGVDRFKVENVKRHFWTISPNLGASQRSRALSKMRCIVCGIQLSPLNEIRWIQMVC